MQKKILDNDNKNNSQKRAIVNNSHNYKNIKNYSF